MHSCFNFEYEETDKPVVFLVITKTRIWSVIPCDTKVLQTHQEPMDALELKNSNELVGELPGLEPPQPANFVYQVTAVFTVYPLMLNTPWMSHSYHFMLRGTQDGEFLPPKSSWAGQHI